MSGVPVLREARHPAGRRRFDERASGKVPEVLEVLLSFAGRKEAVVGLKHESGQAGAVMAAVSSFHGKRGTDRVDLLTAPNGLEGAIGILVVE